jgi:hypothetical protein
LFDKRQYFSTKCAIQYSEVNCKFISRIVKHRSPTFTNRQNATATAKMQLVIVTTGYCHIDSSFRSTRPFEFVLRHWPGKVISLL